MNAGTKYCPKCGKARSRALFTKNKRSRDGLDYQCRAHNNVYRKRQREASAA